MKIEIPPDRQQNKIAFDFLSKIVLDDKKRKLLDVGSADNLLKKYLPKNIKYYSLDVDEKNGKHDFVVDLDKHKIPVARGFFDIVLCLDTLEHTMYPEKILIELKRVNKTEGIFVISLPNEYNFIQRLYYLLAIKRNTEIPWRVVEQHQHIQKPRVRDVIQLLSEHFKIIKIKYHWESRSSTHSQIYALLDKLLNFFARIWPSLFSRDVVVLCVNKKS